MIRTGEKHDFLNTEADAVHALHPCHLILRFQFFGNTLALGHLGHNLIEHNFFLLINFSEVGVQSAPFFRIFQARLCPKLG